MEKVSYALGLSLGNNLSESGLTSLDYDKLAQGIKDVLEHNQPEIGLQEAQSILQKFFQELQTKANEKNIEFVDAVYNSFKACNEANKKNALKINLPYYVEGKDGWYEWRNNRWNPLNPSIEK